jgi:hypothetical protein
VTEFSRTPIRFFLVMLAVVLFFLAAIPFPPEPWKSRLVAAGLFCWCLSTIVPF